MPYVIAIDIGGTFTDLVACDVDTGAVAYTKSPTTYGKLGDAIFDCIRKAELDAREASFVKHGTTLVINALLQRVGAKTALLTTSCDTVGQMSCNPAIGGVGKGQIVREIDALGGAMGRAIDATGIQFRMLNRSKGEAMHSPRAQADKKAYQAEIKRLVEEAPNLSLRQEVVEDLLVDGGGLRAEGREPEASSGSPPSALRPLRIIGVRVRGDAVYRARAVVLTTGTFLQALMHTGEAKTPGGRAGEGTTSGISAALSRLGFQLARFKTGTPPRLNGRKIDYERTELQAGDVDARLAQLLAVDRDDARAVAVAHDDVVPADRDLDLVAVDADDLGHHPRAGEGAFDREDGAVGQRAAQDRDVAVQRALGFHDEAGLDAALPEGADRARSHRDDDVRRGDGLEQPALDERVGRSQLREVLVLTPDAAVEEFDRSADAEVHRAGADPASDERGDEPVDQQVEGADDVRTGRDCHPDECQQPGRHRADRSAKPRRRIDGFDLGNVRHRVGSDDP